MKTTVRDDCKIFEHLEFETGSAIGTRARIGLVVLATDYTVEHDSGVPVTSSNHAMAWHCLRLAGVNDALPGLGRLFELTL